jgi:hypothetical protein
MRILRLVSVFKKKLSCRFSLAPQARAQNLTEGGFSRPQNLNSNGGSEKPAIRCFFFSKRQF